MISGDSTASHMGSVKNIEKARERRTFETMPGSSEVGVPDELLTHANTIHPRMGYDMSDSIFMQEQQAAGFSKEAKRAAEERAALEAFRVAALQTPADVRASLAPPGGISGDSEGATSGVDHKRKPERPPPPIALIRLKKKSSSAGGDGRGAEDEGSESSKKKRSGSKRSKSKRPKSSVENAVVDEDTERDPTEKGDVHVAHSKVGVNMKPNLRETPGDGATVGGALGLVEYSSGGDDDP